MTTAKVQFSAYQSVDKVISTSSTRFDDEISDGRALELNARLFSLLRRYLERIRVSFSYIVTLTSSRSFRLSPMSRQPKRKRLAQGKLKITCESCTRAKVKCGGGTPCARCKERSLTCIYVVGKRRGRRKEAAPPPCSKSTCWTRMHLGDGQSPHDVSSAIQNGDDTSLTPMAAQIAMTDLERRIFGVFFQLFRKHATSQSCCKDWFTMQLNRIRLFLRRRRNVEALRTLTTWMEDHNVEIVDMEDRILARRTHTFQLGHMNPVNVSHRAPMLSRLGISSDPSAPEIDPHVSSTASSSSSLARYDGENKGTEVGVHEGRASNFIRSGAKGDDASRVPTVTMRLAHDLISVTCSPAFTDVFGYAANEFETLLDWTVGGLLPWGGDVMCEVFATEEDVLLWLRILAMKFNRIGRPPALPAVREAFIVQEVDVRARDGRVHPCVVKGVVREFIELADSAVEVSLSFEVLHTDRVTYTTPPNLSDTAVNVVSSSDVSLDLPSYLQNKTTLPQMSAPLASSGDLGGGKAAGKQRATRKRGSSGSFPLDDVGLLDLPPPTDSSELAGVEVVDGETMEDKEWMDTLLNWVDDGDYDNIFDEKTTATA